MSNPVHSILRSLSRVKNFAVKHPKFSFIYLPIALICLYLISPLLIALIKATVIAVITAVVLGLLPIIAVAALLERYTPLKPFTYITNAVKDYIYSLIPDFLKPKRHESAKSVINNDSPKQSELKIPESSTQSPKMVKNVLSWVREILSSSHISDVEHKNASKCRPR